MKHRLVLGSGISALCYLLKYPDAFALAGDQPGGLFAKQQNLGPQLLWVDERTDALMKELGLAAIKRIVKVGFYSEGSGVVAEPTAEMRRDYSIKTRGTEPKASHMSSGRTSFEVWDIGVDVIVRALIERVQLRLIRDSATSVDLHHRRVTGTDMTRRDPSYHYDLLVSTIPAPVFLKLVGREDYKGLVAFDKAYKRVPFTSLPEWSVKAFESGMDYVYVTEPKIPYHRIKRIEGTQEAVLEWTETVKESAFPRATADVIVQPRGQIVSGGEVFGSLPADVFLLGRYAEWNHGSKTNEVLERIEQHERLVGSAKRI